MTFVFYDTETSGINRSFDQILQFAAILVDDKLHEVDQFEIRCRLSPQIVPSISALRTNRITIHQLTCQFASNHDPLFAFNRDPSEARGFGLSM